MIDDEWAQFLLSQSSGDTSQFNEKYEPTIIENDITEDTSDDNIPECEELYISTTTKVLYLNQAIDIQGIFWKIPIIDYWKPEEGVIKKQIKIVSNSKEEDKLIFKKLRKSFSVVLPDPSAIFEGIETALRFI